MKTRNIVIAGLAYTGVALVAMLAPISFASAQFVSTQVFVVSEDRTTNPPEHTLAVYRVTPKQMQLTDIMFMQTQGNYQNKPFKCTDAPWNETTQSAGCSVTKFIGDLGLYCRETVTVGKLHGSFCDDLRNMHNLGSDKPIMDVADCSANPNKCTCYDVDQEYKLIGDTAWQDEPCPIPGNADDFASAPPSKGAGSGGSP